MASSPVTPPVAPVGPEQFKAGMALLAGAVNVVTTRGPSGPAGFTATAVCSVCAEPPTLLVCLNNGSSASAEFAAVDRLCVNTLSAAQARLAQLFGGRTPMADRFAAGAWRDGVTGVPVLENALVAFETRIMQRQQMGTHDVLFCEVLAVHRGLADSGACVYWDRAFRSLGDAAAGGD